MHHRFLNSPLLRTVVFSLLAFLAAELPAVAQTASISGTVTNASGGAVVSGVFINVYRANGSVREFVAQASTNGSGVYTVAGLTVANGPFYLVTYNSQAFVDQIYRASGDRTCMQGACSVLTLGTGISLSGGNATGINFSLAPGGTITGTITEAGTGNPIGDLGFPNFVNLTLYDAAGALNVGVTVNSAGQFATQSGLPAGNYFLRTGNGRGYVDQLYSGVTCLPGSVCNSVNAPSTGTPVVVTVGNQSTANFALQRGGTISGTLTRATGGSAVTGVSGLSVLVYNSAGTNITSASVSTATGQYALTTGLPAGTYYLRTSGAGAATLVDQLYNGIACAGGSCTVTSGTGLAVTAGANSVANFSLPAGTVISGTITNAATGAALSGVSINAYRANGSSLQFVTGGTTASNGTYSLTIANPAQGPFFLTTYNTQGFVEQVYKTSGDRTCIMQACAILTVGSGISVTGGSATGIDFALAPGGRIGGTITDAVSGAGLTGLSSTETLFVTLMDSSGSGLISNGTNASGQYLFESGLPAGNYYIRTNNARGYIDELYNGVVCLGSTCSASSVVASGTPIAVTVGATATANIALDRGATLSGALTNAVSGAAATGNGMTVQVYNSAGTFITSVGVNSTTGLYSVSTGLPSGDYLLRTGGAAAAANLIDELYSDLPCPNNQCTITTGTPLTLTAPTATTLNFALTPGGTVTGTVRNATTSAVLQGASVSVFNSAGSTLGSATSNASGVYTVRGLPAGTYYVRSSGPTGYIDEVYNNQLCLGCSNFNAALVGTAVVVAAGATATADFDVTLGGAISGTVTTGSTPLQNVAVSVYSAANVLVRTATTNNLGVYTVSGLPTGTYYARTANSLGYINHVYNGVVCTACNPTTTGAPISVTTGATTTGIDFSLPVGGSIAGTVTAATGGTALANVTIEVYTTTGSFITSVNTNTSGAYTVGGLPTGSFVVRTFNSLGYLDQLHSGIPCVSCNPSSGTPVAVTAGSTTSGINFALATGGRISGRVTNATTGQGAPSVNLTIYTTGGAFVGSTSTTISGTYTSPGLPTGSYVVYASGFNADLVSEIYDNMVCLGCGGTQAMTGSPVSVTLGATTSGIDFALAPGAAITGTVRDQAGNPISGATVRFFNAANVSVGSNTTNASGVYRLRGMPPGTYYARTDLSNTLNYINQVWATPSNLTCIGCNATQIGAAITVSGLTTVTGIDFSLNAGAAVSGTVTGPTGAALSGVTVQAFSSTGVFQRSAGTNLVGGYTLSGLQAGTYYLRAVIAGSVPQLYGGINCVGCAVTGGTPVVLTEGSTVTGRDFALVAGGTIAGTITDASGTGISGVGVTIVNSAGTTVASASSGPSGQYSVSGLPTGSYFARTSNSLGYVNEVFDNIVCVGCASTGGTAIAVTSGATSTANFSLVQGGRISGTVTAAGSGDLVVGATVEVYNAAGIFLASVATSDAGTYTTTVGLPAGSYFILVRATDYVSRLYNGIPCTNCGVTSGTPVTVTSGATTTGIDLTLTAAGRVTGRILDSGGAGIEGVLVSVFEKATGTIRGSATSNASGVWTVAGLPAGTYTARTSNSLGYVDELYANSTCITCPVTSGAGFPVTAGQTSVNINFTLDAGARISGRVQDGSANNLAGVTVGIFDPQNRLVQSVTTSQLGTYITSGLAAGRYYARTTFNSGGFINQLYSSLLCVNCAANTGTPIDVSGTATTPNINFALVLGGSISGTVTGPDGGASGVTVRILNVDNQVVASAGTAANGAYTVTGLPAGTYWARTANSAGLVDQLYNGIPCVACSTTGGTSIAVTAGSTASGINFALVAGGGISGTVTGPGGTPLSSVNVTIANASGETIQTRTTDAQGQYATNVGLPAGTYYVRTTNAPGYINEAYNNVPCINCNPLSGTGVAVTSGNTTTGIDFALAAGSRITGTVTSSTGTPLEGVTVQVLTAQGIVATSVTTNAAGTYRTGVVPAGSFYVRTRNSQGYTDQVYNGRECSNCNPTLGTAVVTDGSSDRSAIDFGLVFGGRIEGTVRNGGGTGIGGVVVTIYTAGGVGITSAETDATGAYTTSLGLSTGTYYAKTTNDSGYVDRVYNNIACVGCTVTTGTPITVTAGSPTTGIDFTLPSGGRISGTVLDGDTSQPIPGAFVNVFSSTGVLVTQALVGESGAWITPTGLAAGTYYARAASRLGYISKVWNNINCASCSPVIGTAITVTADNTTTGINFSLVKGGKLSGVVTDAATGAPLRNVTIQTYDTANNLVTTSFTDAAGRFTSASGLPVGSYYVRTLNSLGYIDEVYNNIACLSCLPNIGTAVAIGAGADVTGIDFALTAGGKISGTIIETSTSAPLSGVQVRVFDSAGRLVGSPTTDSAGGYVTTGGLPAGTYYVRTVNTLGFLDEVYNNTVCTACDPRLGTGVVVAGTATTTGIDFSLAPGGGVSGQVTASATGNPLGSVKVSLYNTAGSVVTTFTTDASGNFSGSGLAAGTYYMRTFNLLGYVDEAYGDVACAPCAVLSSTAVTITAGNTTTGRNFALAQGGLVSGYVTDNTSGAPLVGVTVSFYLPGTNTFVGRTLPTDEAGYYAMSLPVGTYDAEVDGVNGYASSGTASRLRAGVASLRSLARSSVGVTLGGETSGVAFQLTACTPPAFSVSSFLTGRQGVTYSQTVTATGGTGGLTFALIDGSLTPGLTLNASTGAISGTPTTSGTANFTLGVVDGADCSATQAFAITTDLPFPEVTLNPSTLSFAAVKNGAAGELTSVTGAQTVTVTFSNSAPTWTATSDQSWLSIASGSGSGAGSFTASIANPGNVIGGSTTLTATITVAATGVSNSPATIAVTLTVDQTNNATPVPAFGQVETPSQNATGVQGAIGVTGWALDNVGVAGVKIYRNCLSFDDPGSCQTLFSGADAVSVVFVGDAAFLSGARPDVAGAFPTYPQANRAGWGYLMLTSMLPHVTGERAFGGQGALTIYAVATDTEGNQTLLGRSSVSSSPDFRTPTSITMNNDAIAKPFGAIDTPAQGATISGTVANFGWALTPDSNTTGGDPDDILIPTNGSTATVFIDSVPVAQVTYNQCRGTVGNPVPALTFCNDDVSNIFGNPTPVGALTERTGNATKFRNLDATRAPIGSYLLNTATLSNGLHTIAWSVTDSAGRTEGIGSRFFNVLNGSSDVMTDGGASLSGAFRAAARASLAASVQAETLRGRTGFNTTSAWKTMAPEVDGTYRVRLPELGRMELSFAEPITSAVMMANGAADALPVGASVNGTWFGWMPPAGYFGDYRLVFTTASDTIAVVVTVAPPAPVASDASEITVELDPAATTSGRVTLSGRAFDPKAALGSGIGQVHVWGRRLDVTGLRAGETAPADAAVFLGEAGLDGRAFQFATAVTPGTWELTVYVWNERTARWEDARTVVVAVR